MFDFPLPTKWISTSSSLSGGVSLFSFGHLQGRCFESLIQSLRGASPRVKLVTLSFIPWQHHSWQRKWSSGVTRVETRLAFGITGVYYIHLCFPVNSVAVQENLPRMKPSSGILTGRLVVPLVSPLGCLWFPITMVNFEGGILDFRCENFGFYLIESLLPLQSPVRIFKHLKTWWIFITSNIIAGVTVKNPLFKIVSYNFIFWNYNYITLPFITSNSSRATSPVLSRLLSNSWPLFL